MEKTELREQFFADARNDPYLHAVTHHVASAWADGYEQALRDAVGLLSVPCGHDEANVVGEDGYARASQALVDLIHEDTHGDRVDRAIEWLTDSRRRAQAEALVALAELGKLLPKASL